MALLDNYSQLDTEIWNQINKLLENEVKKCSFHGAILSSADGLLLSSYAYPMNEKKIGKYLSEIQRRASKFSCGGLINLTSFMKVEGGSLVLHHSFMDPLIITLVSRDNSEKYSQDQSKNTNKKSSPINVGLMRSSAITLRQQVLNAISKVSNTPSSSSPLLLQSLQTQMRFETGIDRRNQNNISINESIINRLKSGIPIPFDQRRAAWVMLAKQLQRRTLCLSPKSHSVPSSGWDRYGEDLSRITKESENIHCNVKESHSKDQHLTVEQVESIELDTLRLSYNQTSPFKSTITVTQYVKELILRDVPRTYVNQPLFSGENEKNEERMVEKNQTIEEKGQDKRRVNGEVIEECVKSVSQFKSLGCELLYELLIRFATKHPDIGYCQGMNFIGAIVLIVTKSEVYGIEDAFVIFDAAVCEVRSFFVDDLPGFSHGLFLLNSLLERQFPCLHDHLEKHGVYMQLFASPWLHCLFTHPSVPLKFAMHIFEVFLLMGFEAILRVSLALLALHETEILSLTNRIDIIKLLQLATSNVLLSQLNSVMHLALTFKIAPSIVNECRRIGFHTTGCHEPELDT